MIRVSIAILHFGEISTTLECLKSLKKMNLGAIELSVLVINNDLRVEFPEELSNVEDKFKIKVINNEKNTGFSGGHNQGFNYALRSNSDYHVVLNNDVVADRNLIKELIKIFEKNEKAGAVSPTIYFTKGHEFHKDRYEKKDLGKVIWYAGGIIDWANLINKHRGVDDVDKGQFDKDEETDFATGACMMVPVEVIKTVGKFDDRYFLYYEDGDLNMRIKKGGYKVFYAHKAKLWHNNAASSSSGSDLQDYYISRNRMLFGMSYAPFRTKFALIRESFKILRNGRKWQKKGVMDYFLKRFGKGSYPI